MIKKFWVPQIVALLFLYVGRLKIYLILSLWKIFFFGFSRLQPRNFGLREYQNWHEKLFEEACAIFQTTLVASMTPTVYYVLLASVVFIFFRLEKWRQNKPKTGKIGKEISEQHKAEKEEIVKITK